MYFFLSKLNGGALDSRVQRIIDVNFVVLKSILLLEKKKKRKKKKKEKKRRTIVAKFGIIN